MSKDEALRLALEALGHFEKAGLATLKTIDAITAIKQALAQPEPEPVAWAGVDFDIKTSPPKREPLTDDELIQKILDAGFERNSLGWTFTYGRLDYHLLKFARAIEAAHGIKE
jgi:hypothetical protein